MIRIASRKEGFRRAGVAHTLLPVNWDDDAFTKEQLDSLKEEPMLIVDVIPKKPGPKVAEIKNVVLHETESN